MTNIFPSLRLRGEGTTVSDLATVREGQPERSIIHHGDGDRAIITADRGNSGRTIRLYLGRNYAPLSIPGGAFDEGREVGGVSSAEAAELITQISA